VDGPVWTNREVLQARQAPASLAVLGGGPIGVEIGQGLARFGTRVTVIESTQRILHPEEPEAAEVVADVLRREGIELRTGVRATRIAAGGDGVEVTLSDGATVIAEKLLVAVGRRSNLADIGLDAVGLDPGVRTLDVDDGMRVVRDSGQVAGLYAIGDSTGRGAFTHVAVWQARVLIAELLQRDEPFGGYRGLAWVTFTDPEVGRVGLSEAQARERGITVRTGSARISSSTRGWIHGPGNDGLVKLIEDSDRGVLVGATVVSPYGGEILGLLTLAVHAEVPTSALRSMHYVYPTLHRTVLDAVRDLAS
jgi:pyruvate/2-oxoglutarate dehydrogenase complex dihydrolipoamide dehydrogenase (E3) component